MYRALYRKWRPQRFEDVVGQQATVTALKNQIVAGRVGHAYLFTGVRGTGKTTCAKIFAKAVNCLHTQQGDPCCACEVCRGIDGGSILDVVEMDAASNNGVDNIRELRDETAYTPSTCQYKVYIIDEVHMLSTQAFNALLKTLEEPPGHVIFILATTEVQKVPATILSRCQRYDFTRIRPEDIAGRVAQIAQAEQLALGPGAADLIARLADGALRDALSILDTCAGVSNNIDQAVVRRMAGVTDKSYLFRLSDAIAARDGAATLTELAILRQQSVDMKRLADELIGHYRNLMLAGLPGGQALLTGVAPDEETQYLAKAADTPQRDAILAIRTLGAALEKMVRGNNPRIELELAMFALTEGPLVAPQAAMQQPAEKPASPVSPQPFKSGTVQPFASAPAAETIAEPVLAPKPALPEAAAPAAPAAAAEKKGSALADLPPWEQEAPPPAVAEQPAAQAMPEKAQPTLADAESLVPPPDAAQRATLKTENTPAAQEAAGAVADDADLPPAPDDGDAPLSGTQALPWDEQPMPPAELPLPQPVAPATQASAADPQRAQPRKVAAAGANPFPQWAQVIKIMEQRDPMLYGTLKKSRAYYDGHRVLIDGGAMFRDFIRVNKDSQKLIKKVIAELTGISCGIGPYEPRAARAAPKAENAEQALEALKKRGLDVVIKDSEASRR